MAKVGEGDPRWIVSERTDGANVNSWHWEERDLSQHTHDKLKSVFAEHAIPVPADMATSVEYLKIEEVSEISGDVTVAQRKGKMMCYFELKMSLRWVGKMAGADQVIRGKMEVAEVDHDGFKDEYDIAVTCQENDSAAQQLESVVQVAGRPTVRQGIATFFDALFAEYHIGKQLKSGAALPPPPPPLSASASTTLATNAAAGKKSVTQSKSSSGSGDENTSFSWRMRWGAPVTELYAAMTDPSRVSVYTRSPASMDVKAGGLFSFLGGVISGYYVDVQPSTLIRQQWRLSSWPVGVHSSVVLQLVKEEPGVTTLEFTQSGIPAGQLQSVQEGWKANFFEAIKVVFGYSLEYI
ncbi:Activator of Hsp90 ATPase, N-terminal/Activator of Hsp90 ATPase homolog 1-like protein, putative [Leishmania lindenbergi]|uniref:Activator of Hsp90 ATPase, N-terminal/Activator of Hsp90 ATPase 1-like protein n=1 Tax=Leishmania lindenbergi TaxID=651832 RepID=A0AAW3ALY1_9TRYP